MPSASTIAQAKPEQAVNYELGYRYVSNNTQIQAVLFQSAYANLLGSDNVSGGGMGSGDLFNAGKAMVQGAELSIQQVFQYKKWRFPIQANYTLTKATFEETFVNGGGDWGSGQINKNDLIPFITPHLFGSQIGVENHKWTALLNANYVGATRTLPGQNENIDPTSDENYALVNNIPGFVILDLSLQYEMQPSWKIFANVQNLTNNQNIVANLPQGYRPALPRALLVGFKMQL
jgi:Fe(3+) dicitrate transport protein